MIVDKKGVTLLELLIALIILGIVVGAAVAYQLNASRFFINPSIIRTQIQNNASIAIAHMSQQIRQARYVSFSPVQATITLSPGSSNRITLNSESSTPPYYITTAYYISSENKLIFEDASANTEIIAEGIEQIDFVGEDLRLVGNAGFKAVEITLVAQDPQPQDRIDDTTSLITSVYCREVVRPNFEDPPLSSLSGHAGDIIAIYGSNFMQHNPPEYPLRVYFGKKEANIVSSSATQIQVRLRGQKKGTMDVIVINPDGGFGVLENVFRYDKSLAATIVMQSDTGLVEKQIYQAGGWVESSDPDPYLDQQTRFYYTVSVDESGLSYIEEGEEGWYYARIKGYYDDNETMEQYKISVSQNREEGPWQYGGATDDPGPQGGEGTTNKPCWVEHAHVIPGDDPGGKGRFYFGAGTNYILFEPAVSENDAIHFEPNPAYPDLPAAGVIEVSKFKF